MAFNEIFGASNIYPSQTTYLTLDPLSADVDLQWPIEQAIAGDLVVADIIDVNPVAPGLTVMFPDARQAATGFACLLNNIGANTVGILAADGSSIVSIVSGTVWEIYLIDNTTEAGTWRIFQFGASVSVAVASALAGSGLKAIGTTLNEKMTISAHAVNYNIVNADRANVQQWTAGVGQFTLPDPATVGNDWFTIVKNQGSGNLTVNTVAGLIDGNATLVLAPGQSAWFLTDGANYFSLVGAGSSGAGTGFNLITIDVSGSGNFVLSGGQLNQIGYKFVGVLTGDRHIIVPGTIQEYWVDNETTGAFNLTVGTLAQVSPITVPQGNRNILYCDGSNVVSAESAAVVFPITVGQGGTGATTAPNARTNLGSTAVGDALFTAVSVAAAQATLSVPPTSRLINAGFGMTGGGDLSADRTLNVDNTVIQTIVPVQNIQNGAGTYNFALTDNGNEVLHATGATTYNIRDHTGLAFPVNAGIMIVQAAGAPSLAITTTGVATLTFAGSVSTGTRHLGTNGVAFLFQRALDDWLIWGVGVT